MRCFECETRGRIAGNGRTILRLSSCISALSESQRAASLPHFAFHLHPLQTISLYTNNALSRYYASTKHTPAKMPSIAESKRQVAEGLSNTDAEHDAILASLHDEIDRHNNRETEDTRERRRDSHKRRRRHEDDGSDSKHRRDKHLRFRFKSGVQEPSPKKSRKRSKRSHSAHDNHESHRGEEPSAHPFPREPANPDAPAQPTNTAAFQTSLFDALADDEAAAYWENVYSQPIHIYARPSTQTPSGGVQDMDDETYAAYVQRKMWEKQNPEIVLERERMEKKRREEADAKSKRKENFVHARRKEAWDRAGRARGTNERECEEDGYEYDYMFDHEDTHRKTRAKPQEEEELYTRAWTAYLSAWESLKASLLANPPSPTKPTPQPSKRIPWPTLQNRPATKPNIEDFMRHAPRDSDADSSNNNSRGGGGSRLQALKAERVRWHPDKVQQRFGGAVDEGTMKVVTGVFQVVDGLVEEERKRVKA